MPYFGYLLSALGGRRGRSRALSGLAARCPVPVQVQVDVPVRPKVSVEAVAYFMVAEALTNVARHPSRGACGQVRDSL